MTNVGKELRDILAVLIKIERPRSGSFREDSERIVANEEHIAKLKAESTEYRRRTDSNLAEINRKLNGLIGYVADQRPPEKQ